MCRFPSNSDVHWFTYFSIIFFWGHSPGNITMQPKQKEEGHKEEEREIDQTAEKY